MVVALEANPYTAVLERGGSPYNSTMCAAAYGPAFPEDVRQLALKAATQSFDSDDSGVSSDESERERDELQARKDARASRQAARKARRERLRAKYKAQKSRNHATQTTRETIREVRDDWDKDTRDLKEDWKEFKEGWKDLIGGLKDVSVELKLVFNDLVSIFSWKNLGKPGRHTAERAVDALDALKDSSDIPAVRCRPSHDTGRRPHLGRYQGERAPGARGCCHQPSDRTARRISRCPGARQERYSTSRVAVQSHHGSVRVLGTRRRWQWGARSTL